MVRQKIRTEKKPSCIQTKQKIAHRHTGLYLNQNAKSVTVQALLEYLFNIKIVQTNNEGILFSVSIIIISRLNFLFYEDEQVFVTFLELSPFTVPWFFWINFKIEIIVQFLLAFLFFNFILHVSDNAIDKYWCFLKYFIYFRTLISLGFLGVHNMNKLKKLQLLKNVNKRVCLSCAEKEKHACTYRK